jgi:hypothetical protein
MADISAVLLAWNSVWTPIKYGMPLHLVINSLCCEDLVYTDDAKLYRWTRTKREGYSNMTQAMQKNCPKY